MSDPQYFERPQVWAVDLPADPFWTRKFRAITAMFPEGTAAVLDVGCGDSAFAHLLSDKLQVVGADRSLTALKLAHSPVVCSIAEHLPFADDSFDVVVSSELLEHLPTAQVWEVAAELQRLARKRVIVSVPYRENLRLRYVKCPHCGHLFHCYGHLQTFDLPRLRRLFAGCRLVMWTHCGQYSWDYHPLLLYLRQYLGDKWFYWEKAHPRCPRCGNEEFAPRGNRLGNWCDQINTHLLQHTVATHPYWIVAAWEKKP
jgi:SAM-dependent methyltransferase